MVLKCILTGFSTNTARITPNGSYRTMIGDLLVAIHPSSVLFGRKAESIVYNEFVFTDKSYAKYNFASLIFEAITEANF